MSKLGLLSWTGMLKFLTLVSKATTTQSFMLRRFLSFSHSLSNTHLPRLAERERVNRRVEGEFFEFLVQGIFDRGIFDRGLIMPPAGQGEGHWLG